MPKTSLTILIMLVLLGGVSLLFYLKQRPLQKAATDEITITTTPLPSPIPSTETPEGWKLHTNDELGISFAIPADFTIEENGKYSQLAIPASGQGPTGNTRFFYFSVVPSNHSGEPGEIYNYDPQQYQKLLDSEVNDRINLSDNEGQKDWYTYERYGDDTFNGRVAKVFVNQRPWEFPNGTWEYRYIFELPEKTVIAGAYIDGGPSEELFTLPLLSRIMATFTIN